MPGGKINNAETDGISIWVGGKVSNARHEPMFSKLAIPFLPNNPPRWPEVVEAVKKIVEVYAENARKHERMGEWIERIGWPKFFKIGPVHQVPHRRLQARRRDLTSARRSCATRRRSWLKSRRPDRRRHVRAGQVDHGKKNLKPMDVTKAMIEEFGEDAVRQEDVQEGTPQLIDSGRCIYSYVGGSYVTLPEEAERLIARRGPEPGPRFRHRHETTRRK